MTHSRHFVAIANAVAAAANARCVQLGIVPAGGPTTFVPNANAATGDPAAAATSCVVMGRMPDAAYAAIKAAGASHLLPSQWWSFDDDGGASYMSCFASYDGSLIGQQFASAFLAFNACLAQCGLQRRVVPISTPT